MGESRSDLRVFGSKAGVMVGNVDRLTHRDVSVFDGSLRFEALSGVDGNSVSSHFDVFLSVSYSFQLVELSLMELDLSLNIVLLGEAIVSSSSNLRLALNWLDGLDGVGIGVDVIGLLLGDWVFLMHHLGLDSLLSHHSAHLFLSDAELD